MENQEFEINVRPDRHSRSCACEACEARRERLLAYFRGETTDRGIIPGAFTKGEPKRYVTKGRIFAAQDAIYFVK